MHTGEHTGDTAHTLLRTAARPAALLAALCLAAGLTACMADPDAVGARAQSRQRVVMAQELTTAGRYEDALAELLLAIRDNPTLTTAHVQMGEIYRLRGDYPRAEVSFRRAAELEPDSFDAQYNHGLVLQLMERLADAVRAYLRALAINPYHVDANLNIATAYLQLGEGRHALPYARRAVALDPTNGPARVNLGAILAALNRHEEAVQEFQAAAERMELTPPLLLNLADSLGKIKRYREMATTLGQLTEMDPSAPAFERLGFALFRMNRYADSLDAFRRAVEIDPMHYPALNGVGVCLLNEWLMSGQVNDEARREAVESFRRSVRIHRSQPRVIDLLSRYG